MLSAGGLGLDLKGEVLRLRHVPLPGAAMVVRMDAKGVRQMEDKALATEENSSGRILVCARRGRFGGASRWW